jgi:hypothetical protein
LGKMASLASSSAAAYDHQQHSVPPDDISASYFDYKHSDSTPLTPGNDIFLQDGNLLTGQRSNSAPTTPLTIQQQLPLRPAPKSASRRLQRQSSNQKLPKQRSSNVLRNRFQLMVEEEAQCDVREPPAMTAKACNPEPMTDKATYSPSIYPTPTASPSLLQPPGATATPAPPQTPAPYAPLTLPPPSLPSTNLDTIADLEVDEGFGEGADEPDLDMMLANFRRARNRRSGEPLVRAGTVPNGTEREKEDGGCLAALGGGGGGFGMMLGPDGNLTTVIYSRPRMRKKICRRKRGEEGMGRVE